MNADKSALALTIFCAFTIGCTTKQPAVDAPAAEAAQPDSSAQDTADATRYEQSPKATVPDANSDADGKPNIVVIMGDDIGMWNIGAYHRGLMAGRTPNIDRLASEGAIFTDYYAEASCTAGRANFITGQLPVRTGLTTVGQAGADIGMPEKAPTIATALKELGYATGQFGKNHLGDKNEFLPTVHGFDEFFGYLYHLDAMEDPWQPNYPQELLDKVGPRNVLHSFASDVDDGTVDPRWGRVGRQKIIDEGPLPSPSNRGRGTRHGDGRRRHPRARHELHEQGAAGRKNPSSFGSTPPECT